MEINKIAETIFQNISNVNPLVHNISNAVTINDCANITLAFGGSPIMATDAAEVEEISSIAKAFVGNIGNITHTQLNSIILAGKKCNEINHPVILDPVGVGVSKHRNHAIAKILENVKLSVIRGNISEIKFIATGGSKAKGVDAEEGDLINSNNLEDNINLAKKLSKETGAVIAISGEIDIVANAQTAYTIKNGHALMSKVTGTGCMLSSAIGAFCGANPENILEATAVAVASFGICGELAYKKMIETNGGTGSFRMYLMDYASNMDIDTFIKNSKIEIR
ncbi:MAG: hydroxyethylthiazole kinase [Anaerotignaceae bacterium]